MKYFTLFIIIVFFLFSCKKEKPYNPDDHITYTHWQTTRSDSTDSMSYSIAIPNAFSPNGDGINDEFYGKGDYVKDFEMMIFDRWGNLIFFADDINKHWDGIANHGKEMAQQDVYVYTVKITDANDKKHKYTGTVTIVK